MGTLLTIVYTCWAVYSGYMFLSGRSEWLDRRAPLNIAAKIVLSLVVGYVIGAFYFVYLVLRMLGLFSRM